MAHDPAWPDKVMTAALLVQMGGLLALCFVGLRALDATISAPNAPLLTEWPSAIMATAGLVALVAGVFGYIHQAWGLVAVGILANVASLGFLGVSTVIALVAIVPLVRSFVEGEETKLDRRRVHRHAWPDKAIMASTLLSAGAAACLVHAVLALAGRLDPLTTGWEVVLVAATVAGFAAARQAFYVQRPWAAWLGALLLVASAAFYVVGPGFGLAAAAFLWLADREAEFQDPVPQPT